MAPGSFSVDSALSLLTSVYLREAWRGATVLELFASSTALSERLVEEGAARVLSVGAQLASGKGERAERWSADPLSVAERLGPERFSVIIALGITPQQLPRAVAMSKKLLQPDGIFVTAVRSSGFQEAPSNQESFGSKFRLK